MKVILMQDVARLGRRFEIKEVPDGHALNMLIPKGMVMPATPENVKGIESQAAKVASEQAASGEAFSAALESLKDKTVSVTVEANEQGHMFEALKAESVVEALAADGVTIEASQVAIEGAIKEVGEHTITLVSGSITGKVVIALVAK